MKNDPGVSGRDGVAVDAIDYADLGVAVLADGLLVVVRQEGGAVRLETRHSRASVAAQQWKRDHLRRGDWRHDDPHLDQYLSLVSLGDDTEPDAVDAIVGGGYWTACRCDDCDKVVDSVVILGDEPDYDSNTAYVCRPCLEKALELISGEKA